MNLILKSVCVFVVREPKPPTHFLPKSRAYFLQKGVFSETVVNVLYVRNNIFSTRLDTYLLNISFNSCSETNWPRLATNKVEHGAALMLTVGCDGGVDPTGDANAGDGKKCGNDAACIAVKAAVG